MSGGNELSNYCERHDEMVRSRGELEQSVRNLHESIDEIKEKLDDHMRYRTDNRMIIEKLSKDLNNGISARVNAICGKINEITNDISEIKEYIFRDEIEKSVGFEGWVRSSCDKVRQNFGIIVFGVILFKAIGWVVDSVNILNFIR